MGPERTSAPQLDKLAPRAAKGFSMPGVLEADAMHLAVFFRDSPRGLAQPASALYDVAMLHGYDAVFNDTASDRSLKID